MHHRGRPTWLLTVVIEVRAPEAGNNGGRGSLNRQGGGSEIGEKIDRDRQTDSIRAG